MSTPFIVVSNFDTQIWVLHGSRHDREAAEAVVEQIRKRYRLPQEGKPQLTLEVESQIGSHTAAPPESDWQDCRRLADRIAAKHGLAELPYRWDVFGERPQPWEMSRSKRFLVVWVPPPPYTPCVKCGRPTDAITTRCCSCWEAVPGKAGCAPVIALVGGLLVVAFVLAGAL